MGHGTSAQGMRKPPIQTGIATYRVAIPGNRRHLPPLTGRDDPAALPHDHFGSRPGNCITLPRGYETAPTSRDNPVAFFEGRKRSGVENEVRRDTGSGEAGKTGVAAKKRDNGRRGSTRPAGRPASPLPARAEPRRLHDAVVRRPTTPQGQAPRYGPSSPGAQCVEERRVRTME